MYESTTLRRTKTTRCFEMSYHRDAMVLVAVVGDVVLARIQNLDKSTDWKRSFDCGSNP